MVGGNVKMEQEKPEKTSKKKPTIPLIPILIFAAILLIIFTQSLETRGKALEDSLKTQTIADVIMEGETKKEFGEIWFHLREPIIIQENLTLEGGDYAYVWTPWKDLKAPKKGWLTVENPFYRINVNLDRSYYMLFDKINDRDVFIYNDQVEDEINILSGSDIGFADHGGENPDFFVSTGTHDIDGIGRYKIPWKNMQKGFLLVSLEGWDYRPEDPNRGYDVEAEVLLGVFADKPYYIDANEFNNLQRLGLSNDRDYKDPDEIAKSWVITEEYNTAVIKGGDLDHLNAEEWKPWYKVKTINGAGRKPWHFGSAQFSKMFPDHRIIGKKEDGGIMFSLPEGDFRFDESLDTYGDQVVGEFLLVAEEPVKAYAFSAEPVNEFNYFYDIESYDVNYRASMDHICQKFSLTCPDEPLDWHDWETKRFAYMITLLNDWYNPATNEPHNNIWGLGEEALTDFRTYEYVIRDQMDKTNPLLGIP
jgi:hypothetical protein